jgi:hypothetical protein
VVVEVAQVVVAVTHLNQVLKAQLVAMAAQEHCHLLLEQAFLTHQAVVVALLALTGRLPQERRLLVAAATGDLTVLVFLVLQTQVVVAVAVILVVAVLGVQEW